MEKSCLRENISHGNMAMPFAYYFVQADHPRYHMEPHWHEECEICKISAGHLKITINNQTYNGKTGDIFFVNSGELHSAIPQDCTYECFVFDLHFLLKERSAANGFIYSLLYGQKCMVNALSFASTALYIQSMVNELFFNIAKQEKGFELRVFGCLNYIIGALERENLIIENPAPASNTGKVNKTKTAISYIQRCYNRNVSLDDLSQLLEMKPPSIVRLFKETIGKTPIEYLNAYRINVACEQIKYLDKQITQIALDCGFTDLSYFTKVFKKYMGITPSKYLKRNRQNKDEAKLDEQLTAI